ncbi:MAG TPA: hypothetical protein VNB64_11305 [Solirubrobacteraceae bacterium]|nr:hypothetical protein [Solirubrobacteraceae bacterium]
MTVPDASVSLGAASREQAAIAHGVTRQSAEHPASQTLVKRPDARLALIFDPRRCA